MRKTVPGEREKPIGAVRQKKSVSVMNAKLSAGGATK
jgi:hypothetical protein